MRLACLDTKRLEELAHCCQALNRELCACEFYGHGADLARQAREAAEEMAVFCRVMEATRANLNVMKRLRELRTPGVLNTAGSRRGTGRARRAAMGTISSAFDLISGALNADQSALSIVANNVANANTPGYTEEGPQLAGKRSDSDQWRSIRRRSHRDRRLLDAGQCSFCSAGSAAAVGLGIQRPPDCA
jgi:hypothetical protein